MSRRLLLGALTLFLGAALVMPAAAEDDIYTSDSGNENTISQEAQDRGADLISQINRTIESAEEQVEINPLVKEMRREMDKVQSKPAKKEDPAKSFFQNLFGIKPAEEKEAEEMPKPEPRPEDSPATPLAREASTVYRDRSDYVKAFEISEQAVQLDPDNQEAMTINEQIRKDLDKNVATLSPYNSKYTPPEGIIAYKVAMADDVISKAEAIEIAIANNVNLASMKKRIDGARSKLLEAKRALFPTVSAEVTANGGILAGGGYSGEKFKVDFSQPLYYGGELIYTVKQAEGNLESDRLKYEKERIDLVHQVGEAYRGAVNSHYNLKYQEDLNNEVTFYKDKADQAYEQKLIAEIQILEVESIYNQVVFQYAAAQTALASAHLTLKQALGLPSADGLVPVNLEIDYREEDVDLNTFLRMVQNNNFDIKIKSLAVKSAFYGVKVFDAQKHPRIDLRGSVGLAGEAAVDDATGPDLEKEHFIAVNVAMPVGPNTYNYSYRRRFFGPTISSFLGSEDWQHVWNVSFLDKLSNITDEEIAVADYLKAKVDLEKERGDQEAAARQAFYDYKGGLLQLKTAESKLHFRERQLEIVKHMVGMQESNLTELLNEYVSLAEDKYSRVTAVSGLHDAISNMNRLIGIEGFYGGE